MSSILRYKDFQGSATYEDGVIVVQVLHIDDFITAECDSAAEVEHIFKDLVDGYLATCKAVGKEPSRPFKGSFNVRVSPDLHRKAAMLAAERHCSLNAFVEEALAEKVGA